ncbi:MAG TPA: MFS transporter [Candidatus Acidoferrales bacterium]|nr:MFS transporter [Candidatus Acidoferrales bacterium]
MPDESPGAPATAAAPASSRWSVMFRALQHRNFQLFFGGQLISLIGTWMDTVAEAWLVYRLTGSSLLLGTVAFAGQIPVFLLAPIGGMVADRLNRRSIVVATQTASMILAGILAALTISGRVKVWEVVLLAALMGVVNAFDIPARQAFLVEMVGREDLMNAIALNSSMFNGARVIGPAIAGILVASIGEGWCFFANSVSYIAVIAGLLLMKINRRSPEAVASMLEHIAEGFRFVQETKPIFALLLLLGLVSLVAMPYSVLMPVFAARILHGNARTLGVLMGATGVGALTGALILASRTGLKGLSKWVAFSCTGFGAALILFSLSHWYLISVAMLVPVGFCMMVQMASSNTLIQAMVPDRLRGRTMAVYSMMFMGMAPLGSLLAGELGSRIGAQWTVALGGAGAVIGGIIFARQLPKLRVEARQLILAQALAGGEPPGSMTSRTVE